MEIQELCKLCANYSGYDFTIKRVLNQIKYLTEGRENAWSKDCVAIKNLEKQVEYLKKKKQEVEEKLKLVTKISFDETD